MDDSETNNQILLLAIQRIVKLLNQAVEPELAIVKLLQLVADQNFVHNPCVLLPNDTSRLFQIAYAAGLHKGEYKRVEDEVNNQVFQDNFIHIESIRSNYPAVVDALSGYGVSVKHCVIVKDMLGIPITHDNELKGLLVVFTTADSDRQFNAICNLLCISTAFIDQLLQIIALSTNKTHQFVNTSEQHNEPDRARISNQYGIVGQSSALQIAIRSALRAAGSQASVMLIGESGTGKEKFARMIHSASSRNAMPFIAINCAAIPENLLESELFGYEKGSFTGAVRMRKGKFELASGGTLFLDEIGDMNLDLQSKLLRVLQENVLQRIGGTVDIPVNVRIITATHQNLQSAVNNKLFRLDLFYRLNVVRIKLPPLRERKGDISLLTRYIWSRLNEKRNTFVALSQEAINKLEGYCWPGNIRQLENVLERAAIMSDRNIVTGSDIDKFINEESNIDLASHSLSNDEVAVSDDKNQYSFHSVEDDQNIVRPYCRVTVDEKDHIVQALKFAKGNKTYAAKKLGLTPRQLHYRMEKLKIEN
ncbi:sigma-54 interaction domain-containing protein [Kaarinaea lacus]